MEPSKHLGVDNHVTKAKRKRQGYIPGGYYFVEPSRRRWEDDVGEKRNRWNQTAETTGRGEIQPGGGLVPDQCRTAVRDRLSGATITDRCVPLGTRGTTAAVGSGRLRWK